MVVAQRIICFAYPGARSRPIKEIDVTEKLSELPATQGSMGLDVN